MELFWPFSDIAISKYMILGFGILFQAKLNHWYKIADGEYSTE